MISGTNKQKIQKMKRRLDLNKIAFERLKQCRHKNEIIPFKEIWIKLCTKFSIKKEDCWKLLMDFKSLKKIEFVRCRGVKIISSAL